ncbi:MAG: cupin domain-containing protein [Hyphomicrobiales bacterium]
MKFDPINSRAHMAKVFLFAFAFYFGLVAYAQTVDQPNGVEHIPVAPQTLPDDSGRSLTAVVVKFAPGATAASHHHPGTVFAYVPDGILRSQLDGGEVVEYRAGQTWMEPPGSEHTLTLNRSRTQAGRLLAVFVAPTGAQLAMYDQ